MKFSAATAVHADGELYQSEIISGWDIMGNANGGYLMAIAARAMASASRPHPVSLTAHFLSPGRVGPVSINPSIVKSGRNFSTVRATVSNSERSLIELIGSFSEPPLEEDALLVDAKPPQLPPPEECFHVKSNPRGFPPPMMDKVEMRLHPDDSKMFEGKPSGQALMRGWFRLIDDEPIDVFGLLLAADAFPPTIFNANLPVNWVPTLEMTTHIRAIPVPGWLRCSFSTRFISGGVLEEDGEIWDQSGRLVAQSRQLALMPRS